jgi:exoribonuclease R
MLRAQSKAYYDIKNIGHFGLGLNHYTHFTSPIRRYSDLLVHRDLIEIIFNKKLNKNNKELMNHLTFQEKKSDELERKINDRLCSIYIKINKKKFFTGIVDGIENFGIFIKAVELPFSALARFTKFHNNEENINYKFGQLVSFKIIRNNIKNGKILAGNVKLLEKNE